MGALKYNDTTPSALKFDHCLVDEDYRYDFTTWTLDPAQPTGGIIVEKGKITVNKFKPNTPILASNFTGTGLNGTPKESEICTQARDLKYYIQGLVANNAIFDLNKKIVLERADSEGAKNRNYVGGVLRAYRYGSTGVTVYDDYYQREVSYAGDGDLMLRALPAAACTTFDGSYPAGGYTALQDYGAIRGQGYYSNGTYIGTVAGGIADTIFNCDGYISPMGQLSDFHTWGDSTYPHGSAWWDMFTYSYWQLVFILYTSADTDNDGFITLNTPVVLRMENRASVDITTVEAFEAYVEEELVYDKPRTFASILDAYGFAHTETGTYTEQIEGRNDIINSPNATAYVISGRDYDTHYDPTNPYDHLRLPAITDFASKIQSGYPFKYWLRLGVNNLADGYTSIADSLYTAFDTTPITYSWFANHLFANAENGPSTISLTFDVGEGNTIDMGSMFDHSDLSSTVNFTITSGDLKSLHNAFRSSKTITSISFNKNVYISDFIGSFEGVELTNFPDKVCAANDEWISVLTGGGMRELSEPVCAFSYASDGSKLTHFGNYKNPSGQTEADQYYIATVSPDCRGAFARNNVTTIRYVLDMKFVTPAVGSICEVNDPIDPKFNAMFGYDPRSSTHSPIISVMLKNLNKGNWNFDPDNNTTDPCAGKFSDADAGTVNYMLENTFDLRKNDFTDQTHYDGAHLESDFNSFNGWTVKEDASNVPMGDKHSVSFYTESDGAELSKTLSTSGTIVVQFRGDGCTAKVVNNGTTTVLIKSENDSNTVSVTAGDCKFVIEKDPLASSMYCRLDLTDHFKSELTDGLTSASIWLPALDAGAINLLLPACVQASIDHGWTTYIGGHVVSVVNGEVVIAQ